MIEFIQGCVRDYKGDWQGFERSAGSDATAKSKIMNIYLSLRFCNSLVFLSSDICLLSSATAKLLFAVASENGKLRKDVE